MNHPLHASLVAIEAMARRFGLWEKIWVTVPGCGHRLKKPAINFIHNPDNVHQHAGALPHYRQVAEMQPQTTSCHPRHPHIQGKTNPRITLPP